MSPSSYNAGHLMVVPYRKESQLENLTQEESQELMAFAQKAVRVLKRVYDWASIGTPVWVHN